MRIFKETFDANSNNWLQFHLKTLVLEKWEIIIYFVRSFKVLSTKAEKIFYFLKNF